MRTSWLFVPETILGFKTQFTLSTKFQGHSTQPVTFLLQSFQNLSQRPKGAKSGYFLRIAGGGGGGAERREPLQGFRFLVLFDCVLQLYNVFAQLYSVVLAAFV